MPADSSRAVFLSYASQDADAARRICEALRTAGVEVWFDAEGGLEHGDEWDAKIRRQIKECVLFIAVISRNTQARDEGYFRIEWELAAQRAMGIASGVAFILPVVIDETREPDALVPDRFRVVQWTRLRDGEVPADVQARFLKLWSHRAGMLKHDAGASQASSPGIRRDASESRAPAQVGRRLGWISAAVVLVLLGAFGWKSFRQDAAGGPKLDAPRRSAALPAEKSSAPLTDAQQLAARAIAITEKLTYTRDDLAAAEDMARRATELESGSAPVWGARAWMHAVYLLRNWDLSQKRRQDAETCARRALALDAGEPEALNTLAEVLLKQGAFGEAEALARQALEVRSNNRQSLGLLTAALGGQGRVDEQLAILNERVQRDPGDVLARYDLAICFVLNGEGAKPQKADAALAQLDAALAVQPLASFLSVKAQILGGWKGDLPAMRATLDQLEKLSVFERTEDQPLFTAMWSGLLERKPERTLAAAALTARPYLAHSVVQGPKAWLQAHAHRLAGREDLARLDWLAAEAAVRERLRETPGALREQLELAVTLAWLGQAEETARVAPMANGVGPTRLMAYCYAGLGDAARAVPQIRQAINQGVWLTDWTLPLEPWWDKIRNAPEFAALLAEAKSRAKKAE